MGAHDRGSGRPPNAGRRGDAHSPGTASASRQNTHYTLSTSPGDSELGLTAQRSVSPGWSTTAWTGTHQGGLRQRSARKGATEVLRKVSNAFLTKAAKLQQEKKTHAQREEASLRLQRAWRNACARQQRRIASAKRVLVLLIPYIRARTRPLVAALRVIQGTVLVRLSCQHVARHRLRVRARAVVCLFRRLQAAHATRAAMYLRHLAHEEASILQLKEGRGRAQIARTRRTWLQHAAARHADFLGLHGLPAMPPLTPMQGELDAESLSPAGVSPPSAAVFAVDLGASGSVGMGGGAVDVGDVDGAHSELGLLVMQLLALTREEKSERLSLLRTRVREVTALHDYHRLVRGAATGNKVPAAHKDLACAMIGRTAEADIRGFWDAEATPTTLTTPHSSGSPTAWGPGSVGFAATPLSSTRPPTRSPREILLALLQALNDEARARSAIDDRRSVDLRLLAGRFAGAMPAMVSRAARRSVHRRVTQRSPASPLQSTPTQSYIPPAPFPPRPELVHKRRSMPRPALGAWRDGGAPHPHPLATYDHGGVVLRYGDGNDGTHGDTPHADADDVCGDGGGSSSVTDSEEVRRRYADFEAGLHPLVSRDGGNGDGSCSGEESGGRRLVPADTAPPPVTRYYRRRAKPMPMLQTREEATRPRLLVHSPLPLMVDYLKEKSKVAPRLRHAGARGRGLRQVASTLAKAQYRSALSPCTSTTSPTLSILSSPDTTRALAVPGGTGNPWFDRIDSTMTPRDPSVPVPEAARLVGAFRIGSTPVDEIDCGAPRSPQVPAMDEVFQDVGLGAVYENVYLAERVIAPPCAGAGVLPDNPIRLRETMRERFPCVPGATSRRGDAPATSPRPPQHDPPRMPAHPHHRRRQQAPADAAAAAAAAAAVVVGDTGFTAARFKQQFRANAAPGGVGRGRGVGAWETPKTRRFLL